jgi:hypothetical protein
MCLCFYNNILLFFLDIELSFVINFVIKEQTRRAQEKQNRTENSIKKDVHANVVQFLHVRI